MLHRWCWRRYPSCAIPPSPFTRRRSVDYEFKAHQTAKQSSKWVMDPSHLTAEMTHCQMHHEIAVQTQHATSGLHDLGALRLDRASCVWYRRCRSAELQGCLGCKIHTAARGPSKEGTVFKILSNTHILKRCLKGSYNSHNSAYCSWHTVKSKDNLETYPLS